MNIEKLETANANLKTQKNLKSEISTIDRVLNLRREHVDSNALIRIGFDASGRPDPESNRMSSDYFSMQSHQKIIRNCLIEIKKAKEEELKILVDHFKRL